LTGYVFYRSQKVRLNFQERKVKAVRVILISILVAIGLLIAGLSFAIEPEDVTSGHVWLFDGGEAADSTANNLTGTIVGAPEVVPGVNGDALKFDGVSDGVTIPDSAMINISGGPWSNRTVMAIFNCADVSKTAKQTIFEEGGRTRGIVLYVYDGEVYVAAWNRDAAQVDWNGTWISTPIESDRWYAVAAVIRNGTDTVEDGKFEMWLDGRLIAAEEGSQIYNHSNNNAIGYTIENAVFHDEDGSGSGWYFEGMIDEVWVVNEALNQEDVALFQWSVEPTDKLASAWGAIKVQQ